jgi:hypothetical protein
MVGSNQSTIALLSYSHTGWRKKFNTVVVLPLDIIEIVYVYEREIGSSTLCLSKKKNGIERRKKSFLFLAFGLQLAY